MRVSQASSLFNADFSVFTHQGTGQQSVALLLTPSPPRFQVTSTSCTPPSRKFSPYNNVNVTHADVQSFSYIFRFENPFAHLPVVSSPISPSAAQNIAGNNNLTLRAVPASCATTITPTCLQDLYGIPTTAATQKSNLSTFLASLRPDMSSCTAFTLQTLDGGENLQTWSEAGVEANLDIQYTVGVSGLQSARCTMFVPIFPSGCPFMTSVGATIGISSETVADFSLGGFSNFFAQPLYQVSAVSTFLKNLGSTNKGKFNTTGRGFPRRARTSRLTSTTPSVLLRARAARAPILLASWHYSWCRNEKVR